VQGGQLLLNIGAGTAKRLRPPPATIPVPVQTCAVHDTRCASWAPAARARASEGGAHACKAYLIVRVCLLPLSATVSGEDELLTSSLRR